jgi:deoxyribose-phosphate aldolase
MTDLKELSSRIELAIFDPVTTSRDIEALCAKAREHSFHGVCVNGSRVALAYALLEETKIKVAALIGFPLGATDTDAKRYEVEIAIDHGAHEIDFVLNLGPLREGDHKSALREMRDIVEAADERPVKILLETALMTREEKVVACHLALDSGAQFLGIGTGFFPRDIDIEDVKLFRETLGEKFGIKASGNIKDIAAADALINAGAARLGINSVSELIAESQ